MSKFQYDVIEVTTKLSSFEVERNISEEIHRLGGEKKRFNAGQISYSGDGNFVDFIKHPGPSFSTCWQIIVTIYDLGDSRKVELKAIGESNILYLLNNFLSYITVNFIFKRHRHLNLGISKEKARNLSKLL